MQDRAMEETIKVSVIIPVYRTAQYLPQCLDSVLAQTLRDIEVICINDGSPDQSPDILHRYARRDPRVHVIDKQNEGVGKARNDGLRAARGEFVAFMDSDDYYPHQRVLEQLYTAAQEQQVSVCGGLVQQVYADGGTKDAVPAFHQLALDCAGYTKYRDFQYDYGYTAYLFRRSLLLENGIAFPSYSRFQDPPFFVRAMQAADVFYACGQPTYCYRVLPDGGKCSAQKTADFLRGVCDNLIFSKEQGLERLHYISACRLDEEGSYMILQNLNTAQDDMLLELLLRAYGCVDGEWLRQAGYLQGSYVPEVLRVLWEKAADYDALRKNGWLKLLSWLPRKLSKPSEKRK